MSRSWSVIPARLAARCVCALGLLAWPVLAPAIMAGASPDTPAARVDPNTAGSQFGGVGAVLVNGGVYSGVVIAPQYVLTAGHVAAAGPANAMQFVLHPGAQPWITTVLSATPCPTFHFPYDDLAVLKLAVSVPRGVPVYPLYSGVPRAGLILVLAGYGASGNGALGVSVGASADIKRTGENVLDALAARLDDSGLVSRFFLYDFDGPAGNGRLGGPTLGNALETLVAVGDSGGPAFVRVGGTLRLFGINSFATPGFKDAPVNYTFGSQGGGVVASDPRFAAWLRSATHNTMRVRPRRGQG